MSDSAELSQLLEQLAGVARRIHSLGVNEGAMATRDAILKAVSSPLSVQGGGAVTVSQPQVSPDLSVDARAESAEGERAPRGLARRAVRETLLFDGGLSIQEIEERAVRRYPALSTKSIGNELRRHEDKLYERRGKYSWFLKGSAPTEPAEPPEKNETADAQSRQDTSAASNPQPVQGREAGPGGGT